MLWRKAPTLNPVIVLIEIIRLLVYGGPVKSAAHRALFFRIYFKIQDLRIDFTVF